MPAIVSNFMENKTPEVVKIEYFDKDKLNGYYKNYQTIGEKAM